MSQNPKAHNHLSIEQRLWLDQRIKNRPKRKSVTDSSVAPSLAAVAKKLERNLISDDLNQRLYSREAPQHLQARGILDPNSRISSSLVANKRKLEYKMRKDVMNQLYYQRPEREELVVRGIIPYGVQQSNGIQRAMNDLEKNMKIDKLGYFLQNRPARKSLTDRGIINDSQEEQRSNLDNVLARRPSIDQLRHEGIHHGTNIAPSLQSAAKKLEFNLLTNHMNEKFYNRADLETLQQKGILGHNDVASSLQRNKRALEHAIRSDKLNALLYSRTPREELVNRGIIPMGSRRRSSVMERHLRELENAFRKDEMNQLLYLRPDKSELIQRGILPSGFSSNAVQRTNKDLEYKMTADKVEQLLEKRPAIEKLQGKGIYHRTEESDYRVHEEKSAKMDQSQEYLRKRTKNFHLTRILLKSVRAMALAEKITLEQKGQLKDLIVDQDKAILAVAEMYDVENDLNDFEDSLIRLSSRKV